MSDTVSSTEIVRLCAAMLGIFVAWKGRRLVLAQAFFAPPGLTALLEKLSRDDWEDRMRLYWSLQLTIVGVHALLLVNVTINLFYPSAPIEQPNVASSNIMQLVIPALLIRASELISEKVRKTARTFAVEAALQEQGRAP